MQIATGTRATALPPGTILSGTPQTTGPLVAVAPPPVMPTPGPKRQRVVGLVPVAPGSQHPLIMREKPRARIDPKEISKTRASIRRAEAEQRAAENAWVVTAPNGGAGDPEKLRLANEALTRTAMLKRTLAEMEAAASNRPIAVTLATVREPAEVADELAQGEAKYVCLHDGCRGREWASEGDLRAAHPTHAEMMRAQQCHVFAILCDAPLDPLDPDGEKIGYVAPVGRDGTTVARAVEQATEEPSVSAERVADLEAMVAALQAQLAELVAKKK
jgi:hypothetical protein